MTRSYRKKAGNPASGREDGTIAVEFIFLLPVFLLILTGLVEFGNLWYVRHAITNASREGARAAALYMPPTGREVWARQTAIQTVNNYLTRVLPHGEWTTVIDTDITITPNGPTLEGASLRVDVQAQNYLLLLDKLVPRFESVKVEAATTMRME